MPYRNVDYKYVPRQGVEFIGAAFDTLQKRHDETIKTASALKEAVANLPLNESEEPFKQQLYDSIEQTIADDTQNGFAGYGYNNIVKLVGDIQSNPGLVGRKNAQAEYLKFQDDLDKRKDLSDLDKEYFTKMNPYHYEDKYDENGNLIQGNKWTPDVYAHTRVPLNDILTEALKWAAPDAGGGTSARYIDANGNFTNDPAKAADAVYFDSTTSEWQRLGKDKLRQAVQAAIKSTPGAAESLHQEWEIAKWAAQEKGINDGIMKDDGVMLTEDEYLNQRINPFLNAASYNNVKSQKHFNTSYQADLTALRGRSGAGRGYDDNLIFGEYDVLSTNSPNLVVDDITPSTMYAKTKNSKNQIIDTLFGLPNGQDILSKIDLTKDYSYNMGIINSYNTDDNPNNNLSDQELLNVQNLFTQYYINKDNVDNLLAGKNNKDIDRYNTYEAILNYDTIPTNKYGEKYKALNNALWKNSNEFRVYFTRKGGYDQTVANLKKMGIYDDMGIELGSESNGEYFIAIKPSASRYTYDLINASKQGTRIGSGKARFMPVRDNPTVTPLGINPGSANVEANELYNYVTRLGEKVSNKFTSNGTLEIPSTSVPFSSINSMVHFFNMQEDKQNASWHKELYHKFDEEATTAVQHELDYTKHDIYFYDESKGIRTKANDKKTRELIALCKKSKPSDILISTDIDSNGQYSPYIKIKDDKGNVHQFLVEGAFSSNLTNKWNSQDENIALTDIKYSTAKGYALPVDGGATGMKLVPYGSNGDYIVKYASDNSNVTDMVENVPIILNSEQAHLIRTLSISFDKTKNALKGGFNIGIDGGPKTLSAQSIYNNLYRIASYYNEFLGGENTKDLFENMCMELNIPIISLPNE